VIKDGDRVYFVTKKGSVAKVLKEFRRLDRPYKNIIIAGGGLIVYECCFYTEYSICVLYPSQNTNHALKTLLHRTTNINKDLNVYDFMVFNATFNNISVISWGSNLLAEETGMSGENHRPVGSTTTYAISAYH
jgi:hypothetical protein